MFKKLGSLLVKAGKWLIGNPEAVIAIVEAASKKEKK